MQVIKTYFIETINNSRAFLKEKKPISLNGKRDKKYGHKEKIWHQHTM